MASSHSNLDDTLHDLRRSIHEVPKDGHCIPSAIAACLRIDSNQEQTCQGILSKLRIEFRDHHDYYSDFHTGSNFEKDLDKYIERKQYTHDIVDLVVVAIATMLQLKISIYTEAYPGPTIRKDEVIPILDIKAIEEVYLLRRALHYDALVLNQRLTKKLGADTVIQRKDKHISNAQHEIQRLKEGKPFTKFLREVCRKRNIKLQYCPVDDESEDDGSPCVIKVIAEKNVAIGTGSSEENAKEKASLNVLIQMMRVDKNSVDLEMTPSSMNIRPLSVLLLDEYHDDSIKSQRKEFVELCITDLVKRKHSLDVVKSSIKKDIWFNQQGEAYITEKYVHCCFSEFKTETSAYLLKNILKIIRNIQSFVTMMNMIKNISDIKELFGRLTFYPMVVQYGALLSITDQTSIVALFKEDCWTCLKEKSYLLQTSREFVKELEKFLRNCFLRNMSSCIVDCFNANLDKDSLLQIVLKTIQHTNDPMLHTLKHIVNKIEVEENNHEILAGLVQNVVDNYLTMYYIQAAIYDGRKYVRCHGQYIDLKDAIDRIIAEQDTGALIEVEIFAQQALRANSSFTFPGTNIIISATEILFPVECVWNVSGADGLGHTQHKAADGYRPGDHGYAGVHGYHGESGGNVCILTDSIHNIHNLTIRSHGGNGSDGQRGGNGKPGRDGIDGKWLTESEFKRQFPDTGSFWETTADNGFYEFFKNIDKVITEDPQLSGTVRQVTSTTTPQNYYCEMKTQDNNKVIFSQFNRTLTVPRRQAFCIHYGTDGTPGQKGGDGGCGGKAGKGGYGGEIAVHGLNIHATYNTRIENEQGAPGREGQSGKGAAGGKPGKKGMDNARVEPNQYRKTRYYHGRLELVYEDSSSSNNAYCPNNDKYAAVQNYDEPTQYTTQFGKDGTNPKQIHQSHQQSQHDLQHKSSIVTKEIRQKHQSLQTATVNKSSFSDLDLACLRKEASHALDALSRKESHDFQNVDSVLPFEAKQHPSHKWPELVKHSKPIQDGPFAFKLIHVRDMQVNDLEWQDIIRHYNDAHILQDLIQPLKILAANVQNGTLLLKDTKTCRQLQQFIASFAVNIMCVHLKKNEIYSFLEYITKLKNSLYSLWPLGTCQNDKVKTDILKDVTESQHSLLVMYKYDILEKLADEIENIAENWMMLKKSNTEGNNEEHKALDQLVGLVVSNYYFEIICDIQYIHEQDGLDKYSRQVIHGVSSSFKKVWDDSSEIIIYLLGYGYTLPYSLGYTDIQIVDHNIANKKDLQIKKESMMKHAINTPYGKIEDKFSPNLKPIREYLLKLQYLLGNKTKLLLDVFSQRIAIERIQTSSEIFQWFITRIIVDSQAYGIRDFVTTVATKPQKTWLGECILLQLRGHILVSFTDAISLRQRLAEFTNYQLLLFLSQYLCTLKQDSGLTLSTIFQFLRLEHLSIVEWPYRVRWTNMFVSIKSLHTAITWEDTEIVEAVNLLINLDSKFGSELVDKLMAALQGCKPLRKHGILVLLRNFHMNHWKFGLKSIDIVSKQPFSKWTESLDELHEKRSLDDLIDLIKENNESVIIENLNQIRNMAILNNTTNPIVYRNNTDGVCKNISDFDESDCNMWRKKLSINEFNNFDENMSEILSVINQAVKLKLDFNLRNTQLLSIILFLKSTSQRKGLLQQVATGEGKSLIIVVLAIIKVMLGEKVDIITSSSVLAKRDAKQYVDLFKLFDITVSHNCSEDIDTRQQAYTSSVVYGDIGSFQRDILLTNFHNMNILGSRTNDTVIVDEVDSMLLDKGQNVLYLSHDIPELATLEPLYVHIWNSVHASDITGTQEDVGVIHEYMTSILYGTIGKKELGIAVFGEGSELRIERLEILWNSLVLQNIIKQNGEIMIRNEFNENPIDLGCFQMSQNQGYRNRVISVLKDVMRRGNKVSVPNHLKEFINRHMTVWIENAFKAKRMKLKEDYIIDVVDKPKIGQEQTVNIVIMDNDTGTELYHTQWNHGLHQFLQLKHQCRLSIESLKAVFISNVAFFKRYGYKIYGLSGTLGHLRERMILEEIYMVHYISLPTFRPSQFKEKEIIICQQKEEWLASVINKSIEISQTRPVLVICKSIEDVESFERAFPKDLLIHVYKHSYLPLEIGTHRPISQGLIILATNLAGRGTDLELCENITELGGLHVCLTYLPPNIRIQEQAFGRAARKGQKGTGQLIILDENPDLETSRQIMLTVQRDEEEHCRIGNLNEHYQSFTEVEENLFEHFKTEYKKSQQDLRKMDKEKSAIILTAFLNNWAFSLDRIEDVLVKGTQTERENAITDVRESVIKFRQCINCVYVNDQHEQRNSPTLGKLFKNEPVKCLMLAKTYLKEKEFDKAMDLLTIVVEADECYSEAANYYSAYCLIMNKSNTNAEENVCMHLQRAKDLIKNRMEELSSCSSIIALISEQYGKYRDSFLRTDDYKKQKEDVLDIYSIFINSIENVLGKAATPDMLVVDNSPIDLLCASEMYNLLLNNNVFQHSQMAITINDDTWNKVFECYQLYSQELKETLTSLKNDPSDITPESFKNILPSREELWALLIKEKALHDVTQYVIVDKHRLQVLKLKDKQLLSLIESCDLSGGFFKNNIHSNQRLNSEDGKVCMFPEHLEDIHNGKLMVILQKDFEKRFGDIHKWEALVQCNILCINITAAIRDNDTLKSIHIGKYDGINKDTFTEIQGIDSSDSELIFIQLQHSNILSGDESAKLLDTNLGNLTLTCYQDYQYEIANVIEKHLKYRFALEELQQFGTSALESKPHIELFADLIRKHIIKPVMVNTDVDKDTIKKNIKLCFQQIDSLNTVNSNKALKEQLLHDIENNINSCFEQIDSLGEVKFIDALKEQLLHDIQKNINDSFEQIDSIRVVKFNDALKEQLLHDIQKNIKESFEQIYSLKTEKCNKTLKKKVLDKIHKHINRCFETIDSRSAESNKALKESLLHRIQTWKPGLSKYKSVDAQLQDLLKVINDYPTYPTGNSEALQMFQQCGFDEIIHLCERKWTTQTLISIGGTVCLGIAQITLGALLEVFTTGIATTVAAGLIAEGIGDIIFAIACACSGYYSWKAYAKHKMISLALTVVTGGVGAYFSRGANFSRYGFKILSEAKGSSLVGTELINQAGKVRLIMEAGILASTKLVPAGAMGLSKTTFQSLEQSLKIASCNIISDMERLIDAHEGLKRSLMELYQQNGYLKAIQIMEKVRTEAFEHTHIADLYGKLTLVLHTIGESISQRISQATEEKIPLGTGGVTNTDTLYLLSTIVSDVMKYIDKKALDRIALTMNDVLNEIENNLQHEVNTRKENQPQVHKQYNSACKEDVKGIEDFLSEVYFQLKNKMTAKLKEIIESELEKPPQQWLVNFLRNRATSHIKQASQSYQQDKNWVQFEKLLKDRQKLQCDVDINATAHENGSQNTTQPLQKSVEQAYYAGVSSLLMKTHNPYLFAEIVRESIPVGIDCAQAVTELINNNVIIKTEDNKTYSYATSCGSTEDPIVIYHHINPGEIVGVFRHVQNNCKENEDDSTPQTRNNCLLTAVLNSQQSPISRETLADKILSNDLMKKQIERSLTLANNGKCNMSGVSHFTHHTNGNDKIQRFKVLEEWKTRDNLTPKSSIAFHPSEKESYGYVDLFHGLCVNIQYVVFLHEGNIEGHHQAVFGTHDLASAKLKMLTRNKERIEVIKLARNAKDAGANCLVAHLNSIGTYEQLREYKGEKRFTAHGHDLIKEEDREEFCRGLERERYKIYQVATKLNEGIPPEGVRYLPFLPDDSYCKEIKYTIDNANSMQQLFDILQEPAPFIN